MSVVLTVSTTMDGAAVADALATPGPANLGVDFGSVVSGSYAPVTLKADNTGRKNMFIRHNAFNDPITDVKTFMQQYGTGTLFGYAGNDSAVNDYTKMKTLGNDSGSSKNNADGLSGGLWIDMNAALLDTAGSAQFDHATNGAGGNQTVKIYGDNATDGTTVATAYTMKALAMVIDTDQSAGGDATNGWTPTAPVAGSIGKNGSTTLGDNAHAKLRVYVRDDTTDGGIVQWEWVIAYSYTS